MAQTDRLQGLVGNTGIKTPCRVATTANITLSGEQTIDGIAAVTGDRVLVKNQTSGVNNGIYVCDTSAWKRADDCDGSYDLVTGTLVYVRSGTANSGFWYVTTTGTITVGTTSIAFSQASSVLAVVSAFTQTLLDDADAATARSTLGAAAVADVARDIGQCLFDYTSATVCTLSRKDGAYIRVAGTMMLIPAGGVSFANTNVMVNGVAAQNLAASTTYFASVYNNAGVLAPAFWATATNTHGKDTTAGNEGQEVITGQAGHSLVGGVTTNASSQFQTRNPGFVAGSTIGTISWFNRAQVSAAGTNYLNDTFAATTMTEIGSARRVNFITWGGYQGHISGVVSNATLGNISYLDIMLDGAALNKSTGGHSALADGQITFSAVVNAKTAEGQHFLTIGGQVNAGTSTIRSNGYVQVTVEG